MYLTWKPWYMQDAVTPLSELEAIDLVKTAFASATERDIYTVSSCLSLPLACVHYFLFCRLQFVIVNTRVNPSFIIDHCWMVNYARVGESLHAFVPIIQENSLTVLIGSGSFPMFLSFIAEGSCCSWRRRIVCSGSCEKACITAYVLLLEE